MKTHRLKTWPIYFERVLNGTKTFEIRKNDRDFQAGDLVRLLEFSPDDNIGYTGRELSFQIGYVFNNEDFGIQKGYCVFSLLSE